MESIQKLSRMQFCVPQARCNTIRFNESYIPVTQQIDNMYKYLKQEVNEAQFEPNTLSDNAESFFPPESSPGTTRRKRSFNEDELHNRTRRILVLSQHSQLVQDSSYENKSKMQHAMHSPLMIAAVRLKI